MTASQLNLLVLKTRQLDRLKEFDAALGTVFTEERPGMGPAHFAGRVGGVVLELYPLPENAGPADTTTRLGFEVPDLNAAVRSLEAEGGRCCRGRERRRGVTVPWPATRTGGRWSCARGILRPQTPSPARNIGPHRTRSAP